MGRQRRNTAPSLFIDNRPEAVAQRKLQHAIDNRASHTAQLKANTNEENLSFAQENNTGLPFQLKAGIESLSGYSLDDVKVHYNSSKPAQLQAHAYAQGSDIHVAPGQETHLPHEAWHVVQQKQGRVKPTMQLQGTAVNDDAGLENEADVMGQKAAQMRIDPQALFTAGTASGSSITQRKVSTFNDSENDDIRALVEELDSCVGTAKGIVDSNPMLKGVDGRDGGYLGTWVSAFSEFLADKEGNVPSFFYARYGYAIETIATHLFLAKNHRGYKVHTQAAQGSTRPDFIIAKGNQHHAWIDITSSASEGHIKNKQGGKWNSCEHVSEVLYDMPVPSDFMKTASGNLTEEQLKVLKNANNERAVREAYFTSGMEKMAIILAEAFINAVDKKGGKLGKGDLRQVTVNVCKEHLDKYIDGGVQPRHAAGVLAMIDVLEVKGENPLPGSSWVFWADFKSVDKAVGRSLLYDFGKAGK